MGEKKNKFKILNIVFIVVALVVGFSIGVFTHYVAQSKTIRKISDILTVMEGVAKDPSGNDLSFDPDEVAKDFVSAVLVGDDYASYYTREEFSKNKTEGQGNYSGIGVSLYANAPKIYSVYGNSPAEKAGIRKDDLILKGKVLDGEYVSFSNTEQFITFVSSLQEGQNFELVIKRDGVGEKAFTLAKEQYVCSYVYYYDSDTALKFIGEGKEKPKPTLFPEEKNTSLPLDTAHIVFKAFEGDSANQLGLALSYFYTSGRSKLILDLRGNGGGYMDCLQEVASHFINNGGKRSNLITKVEERYGSSSFYTKNNKFNAQLENIVVLADGGTASASECLIGAMLCYGDANFSYDNLLIAKNEERGNYSTFGKGIMQTTYRLPSGGALKLTTARIFWPDEKTCIQEVGIVQEKAENQITNENAITRAVEILSR